MTRIRLSTLMLLVALMALGFALAVQARRLAEKEKTIRELELEVDILMAEKEKYRAWLIEKELQEHQAKLSERARASAATSGSEGDKEAER